MMLKELILHVLINSQMGTPFLPLHTSHTSFNPAKNRLIIEEIFLKAARIQNLAVGLVYFISEISKEDIDERVRDYVKWSSSLAIETLQTGIDVMSSILVDLLL
jgi:nucleolar MIF4G domain-containing protein 1